MNALVEAIVDLALREDIGKGDVTTQAVFTGNEQAEAYFVAKEGGVLAGNELAAFIAGRVDPAIQFRILVEDGTEVNRGDLLAEIKGPAGSVLTAERTCLNFMQRMSGIATKTRRFAAALEGTQTRLLDTRKTMPGQRWLDKWAVRLGGGTNHRFCLDDMYLIKENHITVAGGVREALEACARHRAHNGGSQKIEIEVVEQSQIETALATGLADIILLDNMNLEELRDAVKLISGAAQTEASGNMTLERLPAVAATGVDFISVGSITHSVHALDISLLFE
ncbi:MAG: carboxylating nicotinate-nucleotide diphosphorylase [Candidatus Cyclonatronum sp.]|uniref:carboxylating nicotinate-nucleotide diphosphorylase n=1 Tax=Cyclonatronum sp. TaxID=3024185 RepID=UPI0025B9DC59|nr:carboxylating nicotinate-nucleotide diphosphorylase [Cyclonatronum sp.]MCC5934146.1 carboxylating nicotinate-nucleotide diphosphorylase [Balneolales bacterium]MCH8486263.1 carboxylating nicotinate-nucleotide diphosphorylase [Cyclonatronum sp.]